MSTFHHHIRRAVEIFGTQKKLADAIGCVQQQIAYLLKAKSISAEMAVKIDVATDGAVSKHDLRPDLFGIRDAKEAANP